ncbi:uncharacterized protein METZ01_LOCUS167898, partial [marine metagenome]
HAPDHRGAAAQEVAALRHERRGPPRGLRRAQPPGGVPGAQRRRTARPPGIRIRGRPAHARPVHAPGGVGAHGSPRQGHGEVHARHARRTPGLPAPAVLQDRAELQEVGSARRRRRLAARPLHRDRCDPVRGLGRHRRGVRRPRRGRQGPRSSPGL